jgi:intein-encoded DNA endonuclease-like protein
MKTYKNLSIEEIVQLILNKEKSFPEVTSKHPETKSLIIDKFHELGYFYFKPGSRITTCIKLKNAAEEYVKLGGYPNTNCTEIGKQFKVSPSTLSSYLLEFYPNIKIYGKANFDEHIFDTIDTEEKAYWLGFIYADGTISSSPLRKKEDDNVKVQYQFELSLSSKDYTHLCKFAKFINYDIDKIYKDDIRCRLSVYSKHLWNVLNCNGCTPQKSLTLRFPKRELFDNVFLIRDFIRGYFDGDGCIGIDNKQYPTFHLLGTSQFLTEIQNYFGSNLTLQILHPEKQSITKYISTKGSEAKRLCDLLYKNSTIYLDRKYDKYLEICRLSEKSDKLLENKIGEGCDANTEVILESKKSKTP